MNIGKVSDNFLIRNLETGFLEIHVTSKEDFLKLSAKNRELLKHKCRWSRPRNCWISKADFDFCKGIAERFIKIGYRDEGWKGHRIPFEKKIMQRLNKNVAIAAKYERQAQELQRRAATYMRNAARDQQLILVEIDRYKKQDLKRKAEISERKAASAMEKANYSSDQAIRLLERSAILELNLGNPKYLRGQLYKNRNRPVFEKQKDRRSNEIISCPIADRPYPDRLQSIGRFKTGQEELRFYKNRLQGIADSILEDISLFYGKPVFMSKRASPDGIGWVVGHIQEESKLVLKLNDGTYISKGLSGLSVLQPEFEILNTLNSKGIAINGKSRIEGFKALAMMKKGNPLEAMQAIRKAGLAGRCLIRCNEYLNNQQKLKQSINRLKKMRA